MNDAPAYNRDPEHRLRVAAAVGPYDEKRIELLAAAEVDALCSIPLTVTPRA